MTAVQPFSYLSAGPAPLKSAFRKQEDLDETTVAAGLRPVDVSVPVDTGHLGQAPVSASYQQVTLGQAPTESGYDLRQQQQQQQQPEGVLYTGNRPDGVIANGYNRLKQRESPVNDQRRPQEATHAKRPPDVAPKQTKALDPSMTEKLEAPNKDGASGAIKPPYIQFHPRVVDLQPENTEAVIQPALGSGSNLYGHVNRGRGPESQDTKKVMPQCTPNDCSVPFSYTQPMGSFADGDMESRTGGSNHLHAQSEFQNRLREPTPVGTTENLNIFDNFILVGPGKSPQNLQNKEVAQKEPPKRLKLQELFDPPPPPIASHEPNKVSILGVTNTESCDYRSTAGSSKPNDSDRTKAKKLVSTFDNPDYNFQDRAYTASASTQGLGEDRPWSARANNAFGEAGNSAGSTKRRQAQGQCVTRKLCAAILITALVTSVVCLGAGFVAGWFGRGKAL